MADDPEMDAYLENQFLERTRDYVVRGRRLAELDDEELTQRWVGLWGIWAMREFDSIEQVALDDIVAEMQLRDREPPFELVADEMEAARVRSRAYTDELQCDPERLLEEERLISKELDAFRAELGRATRN
jgi:hypothetical protein